MESILGRALEYTLKYWLKSFSRDQFKLQGRTVQLSNLDLNGDALHSSVGLPPALNVTTAKVGKLEIMLPSVSNVQIEPIVVHIDRLDLVIKENSDFEQSETPTSSTSSSASVKGSGYGFADKIADGMTIQIHSVNLLLETLGSASCQGGATWAPPMASITIHNLLLYTTNESWKVVNLKEAREFSSNKKYIYVFKKLEWESLSIDLLPHPDMFTDATLGHTQEGENLRDDDGAKRITVQRTELNSPLGLEVQLHVTEAVCPALSEPGLRALLRFMTGVYVCLSRGNVAFNAQQRSTEAAGHSLVSIVVDHIFLCIKDSEFQLELLMQSLHFSRVSLSEGDNDSNLTRITIVGLFLRDTFSHPPFTLVQPSMQSVTGDALQVPEFARSFCPPIYPLGDQQWQLIEGTPLLCLYSLQLVPSPLPPSFASQTVIDCQPLMIHLHEESCLRISSFLADVIVVNPGEILPDFSLKSFIFTLKGLDISVPLVNTQLDISKTIMENTVKTTFTGARLHIENLFFLDSPSMKLRILNLEKDPACFCLWEDQPIDACQKKWTARVSQLTLSLEASTGKLGHQSSLGWTAGLWRCVDLKDAHIEVAMVTADGSPMLKVPPPGGIVRVGIACEQYLSNSSIEQLFFVLDLYTYFGRFSEKIAIAGTRKHLKGVRNKSFSGKLMDNIPSDTSVCLAIKNLQLQFLESSSVNAVGMPLLQFVGDDLYASATHRTFGGAIVVSSTLTWESVEIDCVDTEEHLACENDSFFSTGEKICSISDNGYPQLRPIFWVHSNKNYLFKENTHSFRFLDITMVHVIPFCEVDLESHSLNVSAFVSEGNETSSPHLKKPDNVDVTIELRDWLFALEGAQEMAERWWFSSLEDVNREERCWHTAFRTLQVNAKSSPKNAPDRKLQSHRIRPYPVELVTVVVKELRIMKPHTQKNIPPSLLTANGVEEFTDKVGGIDLEVRLIVCEDNEADEMVDWEVENLKFSIKQPIEAVITKDEVQHLTFLCKSEIDSIGRITAGIIRLLKLEGSVGQSVLDQLGNLGSEGFDNIFSPEKLSIDGSVSSRDLSPLPNLIKESQCKTMEPTLTLLEEAVIDSQAEINALISDIGTTESSCQHLTVVKELGKKIEAMQALLTQLRDQL
ncbi:uncharacterized protein LOC113864716 isoform X3 [Abrus precatorius]|uniref:Uncharacterized protein LOC113864716 isoform X3 n=1 Tax=Abrus precatorius TaxID=3816 RepID=A0A8B8LEI0_ABRPR|nr:uncharacterized protein LOC113864716 isoform X3 [Abrus precatorius]